jgi:hypothetical protein
MGRDGTLLLALPPFCLECIRKMSHSHPGIEETRFPVGVTRREALRAGKEKVSGTFSIDKVGDWL